MANRHREARSNHAVLRRSARSGSLWLFGLSTTLLLIGVWGRAVVVDREAVAETARTVLTAEVVTDRVTDWLGDGIAQATRLDHPEVNRLIDQIARRPEAQLALDRLLDEATTALLIPSGSNREIDVAAALQPIVPVAVELLRSNDVEVDEARLESAIDSVDPVVLSTESQQTVQTVVAEGRALLTRVVAIALLLMLVSGAAALGLAEERIPMLRGLAIRVSIAAASFAMIFRFGGWALDPQGGRSPIAAGSATILTSNLHVFLIVALGAAAVAAGIGLLIQRRQRRSLIPIDADDDRTEELVRV